MSPNSPIVNRFDDSSATNPARRTNFSYDGANRVASIDHKKVSSTGTATTLHRYDVDYDDASRLIEIDSTIDGVSSFTFDELNQLVDADHAGCRDDEANVQRYVANNPLQFVDNLGLDKEPPASRSHWFPTGLPLRVDYPQLDSPGV